MRHFYFSILLLSCIRFITAQDEAVEDTIAIAEPFTDTISVNTIADRDTDPETDFIDTVSEKEVPRTEVDSSAGSSAVKLIDVEGVVITAETGEYPRGDSIVLQVNTKTITPDDEGNFSLKIPRQESFSVTVLSKSHTGWSQHIVVEPGKQHYFVTCGLEKREVGTPQTLAVGSDSVPGPPWVITGCITDSRFDVAIEHDSLVLTFDKQPVTVEGQARFIVKTHYSGIHTFHLVIPGYHEIHSQVELRKDQKRVYHVIATTLLKFENKRREITVTAKRQPVHAKNEVSKVTIKREELQRTAATMNDPVRVLQTLPGVASETDASARPIVRGGEPLEARVFLDGIPLIQPYHFGGARSIFNQAVITNLTIYKSGFPAQYHNAQSAIITADSRVPIEDSVRLNMDINMLQYEAYLGIPFFKKKFGLFAAVQGSYFDWMFKRVWSLATLFGSDGDRDNYEVMKDLVHLPDYKDLSGGISIKPNDRLKIILNDSYNTDKFIYAYGDSVKPVTYNYDNKYYFVDANSGQVKLYNDLTGDPLIDSKLMDTSFSIYHKTELYYYDDWGTNPYTQPDQFAEENAPFIEFEDSWMNDDYTSYAMHETFFDVDTVLDYKSRYNILYSTVQYMPNDDHLLNFRAAWQRRWWDLKFPDEFTEYIKKSIYDVVLNEVNAYGEWSYSGKENHLINAGIQLDYKGADYNVFALRMLHEIITKGNTNFGDYLGPVSGDTGLVFVDENDINKWYDRYELLDRMIIRYKGDRDDLNGSLYLNDEWDATDRLKLRMGGRLEVSSTDTSVTFSPRVSSHLKLNEKNEFTGSAGLYTQNNYEIGAMALSKELKPEKVWHGGVGLETEFIPWLSQKVDLYGKYYYDLISERITPKYTDLSENTVDSLFEFFAENYIDSTGDSLMPYEDFISAYLMKFGGVLYETSYTNSGRGYAYGLEYFLRFDPTDFWHGWISFTLGKSMRQRHPGWRWHPFPLDRPLLISVVNYYRLPRRYELSLKYRLMSGLPYTLLNQRKGLTIGAYNAKRYKYYQRLDLKISRGFGMRRAKGHFYFEAWNLFNIPNMFNLTRKTNEMVSYTLNIPTTALFFGFDCQF